MITNNSFGKAKTNCIINLLAASLIFLSGLILSSSMVHAQGPMPSEIAKDMISTNAFTAPLNKSDIATDTGVVRTALNMRPSAIQLQVGKEYGSGNIIQITNDKIYILTARHVVKNWSESDNHYVIFFNGRVADAELVTMNDDFDAAIVSVSTALLNDFDIMNLRSVAINLSATSTFDKEKNQIVIALDSNHRINAKEIQNYSYFGDDTGIGCKYVYGSVINPNIMVAEYGYKMMYVKCDAHGGMSGGGVYDIYGNYMGILVGGTDKGEMVAVRVSDIATMLKDYLD
ncbi:S1 family peptidase [Butyrivibrio sp. AE3004]|uniref:S1 family peptidase n=1 Tax=Butyrivibrio sp. AE3004 TaxID=1506994 RepID=UPI0009DCD8BA|nr:serine protease [Butyrivibrio sp. AE3004]